MKDKLIQIDEAHDTALPVALWQKLGFSIAGTLPKAFRHKGLGYVDAYVMSYNFV